MEGRRLHPRRRLGQARPAAAQVPTLLRRPLRAQARLLPAEGADPPRDQGHQVPGRATRGAAARAARRDPPAPQGGAGPRAGPRTRKGYVFTSETGEPLNPSTDYHHWKRLLREAGIRDGRLHDARHTASTVLLLLGVPERIVMAIMGCPRPRWPSATSTSPSRC
ncbi:tyrosine-type recombinase/integrase [Kitasatospora sp. NPDC056731]|uniref:tyrosine-type recombinase/integrase n=1 Tax=Kitasatospora sp. NPDC056731 TaxID=3155422 RepID=UPI00341F8801